KIDSLKSTEPVAELSAQLTLLEQSVANYLELSTTELKVDEYYTKIIVQLEELESKFSEFDEFVLKIADKRDEVIKAFNSRREQLVEQVNKRSSSLEQIGLRVLKNIENKSKTFNSREDIQSFYASDLMIDKIRQLVAELKDLSDVSKAENLENLLKKSQEDALRILRDKTELYVDGDNIIALGKHKFTVNKQPLSLTLIRRNNELYYHLTGTSFFQEVKSSEILAYQDIWEQELVSENNEVYRAEYLAYQTLLTSRVQSNFNAEQFINQTVEQNYTENYIKEVHNVDALAIYLGLAEIDNKLDLLRFDSQTRAIAQLFWHELEVDTRDKLAALVQATAAVMRTFPNSKRSEEVIKQISKSFHQWPSSLHLEGVSPSNISNYIFQTFSKYKRFTLSETADHFRQEFLRLLEKKKVLKDYEQDINQERFKNEDRYLLITNWLYGYVEQEEKAEDYGRYIEETAAALLFPKDDYELIFANDRLIVDDLKGNHPSIT